MSVPAIGTPVIHISEIGYVSRVRANESKSFSLGSGSLRPILNELEIVWPARVSEVPDTIAETWIQRAIAAKIPAISAEEIEARRAFALDAQKDARDIAQRQREEMNRVAAAFKEDAKAKTPAWAQAVIVGELIEDKSDSMTDYFASATKRVVILAFSKHTRDIFSEMRAAALNHPETAFLNDAPENAEHREKYSMGGGYYLKAGGRHSCGWQVRKCKLYQGAESVPVGEWSLTPPAQAKAKNESNAPAASGSCNVSKHHHTKHGFDFWLVQFPERVSRDTFDKMRDAAKACGGWYSRQWGSTPGGFAFKSEAVAQAFATDNGTSESAPMATESTATQSSVAEKLRALADKMQGDIESKLADRLTNTPKRQREAASARQEGARLKRTQAALRALADLHENGKVPAELRGVATKAAVYDLVGSHIDRTNAGYYDAGIDTNKPAKNTPAALTLWSLLAAPSETDQHAADLRAKTEKLQFANIAGYFPTPAAVVARMIEAANIPDGCEVLEPSAGSGAILDVVRQQNPACRFVVYEQNFSLADILKLKGYTLSGSDFMESDTTKKVARVLMNPPFEKGQDIEHVRRAFDHLESGGRLVSIMSPGPFFRSDSKARAFREWFGSLGGERIELPAGSFKESGTGVGTVIVTIDAP